MLYETKDNPPKIWSRSAFFLFRVRIPKDINIIPNPASIWNMFNIFIGRRRSLNIERFD